MPLHLDLRQLGVILEDDGDLVEQPVADGLDRRLGGGELHLFEDDDVPLLDAIAFDTDIPAAVLVTLTIPASGFLRTETVSPSGTGRLGLEVDGTIVEEALYRPMSEGQAAPSALVAMVTVPSGHHVLRIRRRVDDLTTGSRFLVGDTVDGVRMEKIFHVDLAASSMGPQAESPPPGRIKSLVATLRSEGAVLSGLHVPLVSAQDDDGRTRGSAQLFIGDDRIEAALGASEALERAASLLWISPYPPGASITVGAGRGGQGPLLFPRGARLFAASFRSSPDVPAPPPVRVTGAPHAAPGTTTVVARMPWHATVATRALLAASLARVYSARDGGSGFITLRCDDEIVSRVFFQSQGKGVGQGVSLFALATLPPGPHTITLELESRLGEVVSGDDAQSCSALTALPLR